MTVEIALTPGTSDLLAYIFTAICISAGLVAAVHVFSTWFTRLVD